METETLATRANPHLSYEKRGKVYSQIYGTHCISHDSGFSKFPLYPENGSCQYAQHNNKYSLPVTDPDDSLYAIAVLMSAFLICSPSLASLINVSSSYHYEVSLRPAGCSNAGDAGR